MRTIRIITAAALGFAAWSSVANAQIVYGKPDNTGGQTLRFINPDGTADAPLNLPFPKTYLPAWSTDGTLVGVTAVDPARPSLVSLNAWVVNVAAGTTQQITHYVDRAGGGYSIAFAWWKAFSPDKKQLAVVSWFRSDEPSNGYTGTYPFLQLFPSNGDPGPTATLHGGPQRDEVHHDGEGVDWSPQNKIALPFQWNAPLNSGLQGTYGPGEATAIFLVDPASGSSKQLTVPHADVIFSGAFVSATWAEEDYAPKFSPDGSKLAYVRSYQQASASGPARDVQSIRIIDLATGNDRQVISFQQGLYVSRVDWSPDATQLIFDIGQQSNSNGYPIQFVDPATDSVNLVNVDGSNPHPIVGVPSTSPAWRSGPTARPALLANVSTRMSVGTGDSNLIGGFIITGFQPKKVIIRGLGPSLAANGVPNVLTDPLLELHQGATIIATNDNWQTGDTSQIPNGFAPTDPRESVIVTTLNPGAYTANVRGAHGEVGSGLVEAYDLSANTSSTANISTRGPVNTGNDIMIGGFFVGSGGSANVIVRALGPSLTAKGVAGALQDPTLDIRDGNGASVAFNDNWESDANAGKVQSSGVAPADPRESAIYKALAPGAYTAVVRGNSNSTGVALFEAYNLQ